MHRVKEMRRLHHRRDPVIDVVVGQDRAQKLLLGFDVVGQGFHRRIGGRGQQRSERGDLGHSGLLPQVLCLNHMPRFWQWG